MQTHKPFICSLMTVGLLSFFTWAPGVTYAETTLTLEKAIHVTTAEGSDAVLEAGNYVVEPAQEWLRITLSGESPATALLVETQVGSHEEQLDEPLVLLAEGDTSDTYHLVLLLLNGEKYESIGSTSGLRTRGSRPFLSPSVIRAAAQNAKLIISNLTVASGKTYGVPISGLQVGATVYIDRPFTFTTVPASVQGFAYIQTANDDKAATIDALSFMVHQPVAVYIGHDVRITQKPSWLNTFTDTGSDLVTSDTTLHLFVRFFPAGLITLGGNHVSGTGGSMYSVIVKPQGGGGIHVPPLTLKKGPDLTNLKVRPAIENTILVEGSIGLAAPGILAPKGRLYIKGRSFGQQKGEFFLKVKASDFPEYPSGIVPLEDLNWTNDKINGRIPKGMTGPIYRANVNLYVRRVDGAISNGFPRQFEVPVETRVLKSTDPEVRLMTCSENSTYDRCQTQDSTLNGFHSNASLVSGSKNLDKFAIHLRDGWVFSRVTKFEKKISGNDGDYIKNLDPPLSIGKSSWVGYVKSMATSDDKVQYWVYIEIKRAKGAY